MAGRPLADAAAAALSMQPDIDLAQLLAMLLNNGAFGHIDIAHDHL
ncbi:hypothetical protein RY831_24100 [Noviherbaspirillum sp. CPCC 100848]|jgi:hypothetical protein|uniref:Uncharacterized protein n=1 Tax=Noviherbaspirillum album TaxID=3080276 RepID=A0ABU6JF03_9BURK|nr:hypothetical protein [Noviherbaspirillum sp. CPCC 100848]MEC4722251.1 hypothetical protein [Noviherbaspirillum sp. CPCC 100848]